MPRKMTSKMDKGQLELYSPEYALKVNSPEVRVRHNDKVNLIYFLFIIIYHV